MQIKEDKKVYFGGDQSWWKDTNSIMREAGCGVIAMCNLELYLNGGCKKGISYCDYISYVQRRHKETYNINQNIFKLVGLTPRVMERGLDVFFQERCLNPIISWAPTVNKKRIRKLMEKMLGNNIPIVASYYVFNKKRKLDLYTYDEEADTLRKEAKIGSHYFNVVGIASRDNRDLLIISTWGQKYYAYFDEWVKKISIFTNILYVE